MRAKYHVVLALLIVVAMLLTASCGKKTIKPDTPAAGYGETGDMDSGLSAEDRARQRELDEERLRRQREEQVRQDRIRAEATRREMAPERSRVMDDNIYFPFDSAALSSEAQAKLREKADWLRRYPEVSVIIEGHCDERGTSEYNLALGDRRAESAKRFLVNLGISPARLTTISYGEERPVDPGHNEAAWARNRRGHFVIE